MAYFLAVSLGLGKRYTEVRKYQRPLSFGVFTMIRTATTDDAQDLCDIYAPYVENTAISFELKAPTVTDFAERILCFSSHYPFLVYEEDGAILGFAYASKYHDRAAYQHSASVSVYLSQTQQNKGIGSALYAALFRDLEEQGVHTCLACVTLPNEKSLALHQKFGFEEVGIMRSVGYKLGQWHDVIWLQKML